MRLCLTVSRKTAANNTRHEPIDGAPRCGPHRRGVATVELAVCLPVIVLLVLGAMEATNMVFLKQSLAVAAYEGGRTSVVPGATTADVVAKCQEILDDRKIQGAAVSVTPGDVEDLNNG